MILYDPADHRSTENGYQNPETALEFAKQAVKYIEDYVHRLRIDSVCLLGMDGSSSFLATVVKLQQPDWCFVSGVKDRAILKSHKSEGRVLYVFCDDYIASGNAIEKSYKAVCDYRGVKGMDGCFMLALCIDHRPAADVMLEGYLGLERLSIVCVRHNYTIMDRLSIWATQATQARQGTTDYPLTKKGRKNGGKKGKVRTD